MVAADGAMSIDVTESWGGSLTRSYVITGQATLDTDGNLAFTGFLVVKRDPFDSTDDGEVSFLWSKV